MPRAVVHIWEKTYQRLVQAAETSGESQTEVLDKALTRYMGHISDKTEIQQLKAEVERLKSQSPQRTVEGGLPALESGVPPEEHEPSPSAPDPSTLPLGASRISPLALTATSTNTTHGNAVGTQSSPQEDEYQRRLNRVKELAQLKEDHVRRLEAIKTQAVRQREEYKSEGDRQRHWKPARAQPLMDELAPPFNCPQGFTRNYCYNSLCELHGECMRNGLVIPLNSADSGGMTDTYLSNMR